MKANQGWLRHELRQRRLLLAKARGHEMLRPEGAIPDDLQHVTAAWTPQARGELNPLSRGQAG